MTRTDIWKRPQNQRELVAFRAAVRAEAFEDAASSVRFAGKTGRGTEEAAVELEGFASANRQEADFYAHDYYVREGSQCKV